MSHVVRHFHSSDHEISLVGYSFRRLNARGKLRDHTGDLTSLHLSQLVPSSTNGESTTTPGIDFYDSVRFTLSSEIYTGFDDWPALYHLSRKRKNSQAYDDESCSPPLHSFIDHLTSILLLPPMTSFVIIAADLTQSLLQVVCLLLVMLNLGYPGLGTFVFVDRNLVHRISDHLLTC